MGRAFIPLLLAVAIWQRPSLTVAESQTAHCVDVSTTGRDVVGCVFADDASFDYLELVDNAEAQATIDAFVATTELAVCVRTTFEPQAASRLRTPAGTPFVLCYFDADLYRTDEGEDAYAALPRVTAADNTLPLYDPGDLEPNAPEPLVPEPLPAVGPSSVDPAPPQPNLLTPNVAPTKTIAPEVAPANTVAPDIAPVDPVPSNAAPAKTTAPTAEQVSP